MNRYDNPLYRYVSPVPNMYRNGWEEVYRQGVIPQALGEMASRLVGNGLIGAEQWAIMNNHPIMQEYINKLRTLQQYRNMISNPDTGRYTGI